MNVRDLWWTCIVLTPSLATAEVEPASIRIPESTAWTGQRVSMFVDLRARGSFAGTASFSLPKLPQTVLIPAGTPVVSSKTIDGEDWFVQSHEFSLFSQQTGTLKIPAFKVRFSSRDGFTGPASEQQATVAESMIEIRRPPGSEQYGFLVTTDSITINETWNPQPGTAQIGDLFKRTIDQRADQMTGMALAPPPQNAPAGVRVYLENPQVTDKTERGDFLGERRDTITYVMQEPGTQTLPAITYVWWDPQSKELGSKTLPSVTFEVAAPSAAPSMAQPSPEQTLHWGWWLAGVLVLGAIATQWRRIVAVARCWWKSLHPPDRDAARGLLRACRQNDPVAASHTWLQWLELRGPDFAPTEELVAAVIDLERHIYGRTGTDVWQGERLAGEFSRQIRAVRQKPPAPLPPLNPLP